MYIIFKYIYVFIHNRYITYLVNFTMSTIALLQGTLLCSGSLQFVAHYIKHLKPNGKLHCLVHYKAASKIIRKLNGNQSQRKEVRAFSKSSYLRKNCILQVVKLNRLQDTLDKESASDKEFDPDIIVLLKMIEVSSSPLFSSNIFPSFLQLLHL